MRVYVQQGDIEQRGQVELSESVTAVYQTYTPLFYQLQARL